MPRAPAFPSPVRSCPDLSTPEAELWIKDDGLLLPEYGGNKIRKLGRILERAQRLGAKRVVSFGAAGSHHVLSLSILAPEYGLQVAAALIPQPPSAHARDTLRAIVGQGCSVLPAATPARVPLALARAMRPGDHWVPPGGSSLPGTLGYVDAVEELSGQIERGELPPPDQIVVALGSGGTAAGLTAGVIRARLPCRVHAVKVVPGSLPGLHARHLARRVLGSLGLGSSRDEVSQTLRVVTSELGPGYGHSTASAERAASAAQGVGLSTDPTYTAKAFAHALSLIREAAGGGRTRRVLFWNTLSGAPLEPLLAQAPAFDALPAALRALLRPRCPK